MSEINTTPKTKRTEMDKLAVLLANCSLLLSC